MPESPLDVIVIGAGVAGLAAAQELAGHGQHVEVLEARERIGGRILSVQPAGWPAPIELGAEFIHGGNPAMREIIARAGIPTRPVAEKHWLWRDGSLVRTDDVWQRIDRVLERIDPHERGLQSFHDFLVRHGDELTPSDRALARTYVEGFHAAEIERISAAALAGTRESDAPEQSRPVPDYGALVAALATQLTEKRVVIRCNSVVERVHWRRGHVGVHVRHGDAVTVSHARAALITLPLGVLQAAPPTAGAVVFEPPLAAKQATIHAAAVGHAIRVGLRFAEEFWNSAVVPPGLRVNQGAEFGFLHSNGFDVPVWWAEAPHPVVVGWAGGPAAIRLSKLTPDEIVARALASLAALLGGEEPALRELLRDARTHNWSADPFSRGAYSYATAGADDAPERLREPIDDTLYFAGEATADPEEIATVHGALASGLRAARELNSVASG